MSASVAPEALTLRALEWLVRLPLLGDEELAQLLGVHELDAAKARHALERLGGVEWAVPGSPELRPRRLSFVRDEAVAPLAALLELSREELVRHFMLRPRDVLARIGAMETAVGINRLFAGLAEDMGVDGLELVDGRALPAPARASDRWWPSGVDAYGCLSAGELDAPFFVAWDRSGVPVSHRRERVSSWYAFMKAQRAWGASGLPPIVVVCAGERELEQWRAEFERRAARGDDSPLDVILGQAADLVAAGAGGEIWRSPGVRRPARLAERLAWGPAPPAAVEPPSLSTVTGPLPEVARRRPPLRERAANAATAVAGSTSARERLAALTLATDADEKLLMEWLGHHPLLETAQLSTLLDRPAEAIARRIDWLLHCGALEVITRPAEGEDSAPRRLVLTGLGLRWLAARDGVLPRRHAKHGVVAGTSDGSGTTNTRLDGLLRHLEHSVGVNRVLVRLAAGARQAGHRLAEWRNEAESTRRFRDGDRSYWIRPDAGGSLWCGEARHQFLLEYDRGTLDAADYRSKLVGYHRYFGSRQFERDCDGRPTVLVVAANDQAEERIAGAVRNGGREFGSRLPLLLTSEWRFERDSRNDAGLLGAVWRFADADLNDRTAWPPHSISTTTATENRIPTVVGADARRRDE